MILAYYNNKWKHRPTIRIDVLDYNDLFSIAKLYNFSFLILIVQSYNKNRYDLVYKKACLVEISNAGLYNTIFNNYILKKSKPSPNDLWIFALNPLVIVRTILAYTEL